MEGSQHIKYHSDLYLAARSTVSTVPNLRGRSYKILGKFFLSLTREFWVFNRKEIPDHFPFFIKWLKTKKIEYPHTFDFIYFKKWILEETQQNLERNIALLHKTFF